MIPWTVTRPLRGVSRACSWLGSEARKLYARAAFPGVRFAGRVHLERGVTVSAVRSGRVLLVDCHVARNTIITAGDGGSIQINADYIGPNSIIVAQKRINLGEGSKLAEMVVVRDANHDHSVPLSQMRFTSRAIEIGADVWLGARSTVLPGVSLGDHVTVGAGAVVTSSFSAGAVVVGVPARVVRR